LKKKIPPSSYRSVNQQGFKVEILIFVQSILIHTSTIECFFIDWLEMWF